MSTVTMSEVWNNYDFHVRNRTTGEDVWVKIKDFFDNVEVEGGEE